jgi:diguanylate cyclase (GGDEF)-like protein/PAS domain S-box-containing protein
MAQGRGRQTHAELERFRTAMDMCGDAIYLVDRKTMRFVDINQTACTRMGYSREELLQMGPQDLLAAGREEIEGVYDEVIAAGASGTTSESSARTKYGRESITELHRRALRTDEGWIIVSIARDITQRKLMEQALREGAENLRVFTDNVPVMTASWDEDLHCRFANRRFVEFFGFTVKDILGTHVREILGEEEYAQVEGFFLQVLQGNPVTFQRTHKLQNGEALYLEIKLLPHIGDQGKVRGCFAVATDISEHKLTEERIQRVAHHDSLTGLPNRLLFNDRLFQAISLAKREARQIALLYLDLDKFKPVNDALGHTAGDELLKAVATRIRQQVRESDTVARVGGDEFTVILPGIAKREQAETVARKIIAALAAPFQLDGQKQSVDIGTSIGIAVYPADAPDADALVKVADAAMYIAKREGNSFRSCAAVGQRE